LMKNALFNAAKDPARSPILCKYTPNLFHANPNEGYFFKQQRRALLYSSVNCFENRRGEISSG
ncbi:hypothetical protein RCN29_23190, partial [Escherichia coli]|nr:hypothetical protein [Escherichia coli]